MEWNMFFLRFWTATAAGLQDTRKLLLLYRRVTLFELCCVLYSGAREGGEWFIYRHQAFAPRRVPRSSSMMRLLFTMNHHHQHA